MRTVVILLFALGGCASDAIVLTGPPSAADAGVIPFRSLGSLQRSGDRRSLAPSSEPAAISGELLFPDGKGPFPAVVLAHGCNGNRGVEPAWGRLLREWGYATFNVDSFRGRGLTEVCTQGQVLVPLQRVPDAYGALRLLAVHPKIDPQRIALMGFSHGGALTMLAATAWAKDSYAPAGAPAFRAFFPFYPNCNARFPERDRVSAPVRIHAGEADDWTPAKPCADLAAALKAAGQDVGISVYPGAHHAFDQAQGHFFLPNVGNGSGCFPVFATILGPITAGNLSCVKRGATIAGSPSAAAQARKNLHAQLEDLMK